MPSPLEIQESLTFAPGLSFEDDTLKVRVRVYSGEVEYIYLTEKDAIAIIDHLSTIFNLGE
jgi:hypothetical protein